MRVTESGRTDECEHLARQSPDHLPALITALGRTATKPAAIDQGRGPSTLSDDDLVQRTGELGNRLQAQDDRPTTPDGGANYFVEYPELRKEIEARHRDRIAAIQYQPPEWIVAAIGERPIETRWAGSSRRSWISWIRP